MYSLKSSLSFNKKNDQNVQRLIKKATHHTNVDEDWNLFIQICTEVNCTKGASQRARIALSKYLSAFNEPQTQYLAFSLLREICTNCGQFEVELRNKEFVALIQDLWCSKLHQKVRDNFSLCISIWVNAYRDDLYFHHLMNFCNSVYGRNGTPITFVRDDCSARAQAWFRQSSFPSQPQSPPLSPNGQTTHASASCYQDNPYTPNNNTHTRQQQRNDHVDDNGSILLDDIQRPNRTSSNIVNPFLSPSELLASASSSTSNRDTAYNMILRTSRSVPTTTNGKGKARLNPAVAAMSRHDMDALIYEAETAAKLLTDLMEGPMDINTNDVLEDLQQNCRSIHARIIKQVWTLEGDELYHDALTDAARGLFTAINQYKKISNEKLLIEA